MESSRDRLLSGLPVDDRRLQLAGVSIAVLEGGEGPPIVFLQGEFAAVWMRVIPDLVATHRVVAPEHPGPGGALAARYAVEQGDRISGLERSFRRYCYVDLDGTRAAMGESYDAMVAYALDRFRTPSVKAASARYGWPLLVIDGARDDPAVEQPAAFLAALHA